MYQRESRQRWTPALLVTEIGHAYGAYGPGTRAPYYPPPDEYFTFREYPYRALYEVRTAQGRTSRKKWNRFEHFRSEIPGSRYYASSVHTSSMWVAPYATANNRLGRYCGVKHADVLFGWRQNSSANQYCYQPYLYGDSGMIDLSQPNGTFVPLPAALENLIQASLEEMMPKIKSEVSILNFLYELKDLKRLPELLRQSKNFLLALGRVRKMNLRTGDVCRLVSEHHLNYSFGVAPMISDLRSILYALERTIRRMNDLVSREGKTQTSHFTCRVKEFESGIKSSLSYTLGPSVPNYWYPGTNGKSELHYWPDLSKFHAECQYNYNYTDYQRRHAVILSLLDAFDLGGFNPAIIWNALPFSFIVDWFAKVANQLDAESWGAMDPKINIHRFLWSIRRRNVTQGFKTLGYHPNTIADSKKPMPVCVTTAYRREVTMPAHSAFALSGLSLREITLSASLVNVLSRKRRYKWR